MVLVVRCLICSKELSYEKNDPSQLILHVQQEHPQSSRNSRNSNRIKQTKDETEKILNQSLRKNSVSLNSLIDNETQTDIVWNNLFMKMNQQQQTSGPSKSSPRASKETQNNERASKESIVSRKSDTKVLLRSPSPQLREVVSSPSRFSDELHQKFHERTPLKASTPIKPTTTKHMRDRERVQLEVGDKAKVLFTRDKDDKRVLKADEKRVKFYKTSIERWRPVGDEKIHCPRCHAHKRPVVRTHTEHVTESSFTTTLLMTCWPLCMSPCLFPEPTQENLHCPVCNYHLGFYDHVKKVVLSNPELSQ